MLIARYHFTFVMLYYEYMQIILGEDGCSGAILEHSAADGVCAVAANQFVLDLLYRSVWCSLVYFCIL